MRMRQQIGVWMAASVVWGGSVSAVPAQPASALVGVYQCAGTNPDGSSYRGMVEISEHDGVYHLTWQFDQGGAVGIGVREGAGLAVVYQAGMDLGLVAYVVDRGTGQALTLRGRWILPATEQGGTETLTKQPAGTTMPSLPPARPAAPAGRQL